ncbi:mRNA binding protein puf3 [Agyrium rufum]|nr:mRNA binding protein puf3 [Agyrium rufum]
MTNRSTPINGYQAFGKPVAEQSSGPFVDRNNIWGNGTSIGGGFRNGTNTSRQSQVSTTSTDAVQGSGSLLPLSEVDPWTRQKSSPWSPISEIPASRLVGGESNTSLASLGHRKAPSGSPFLPSNHPVPIGEGFSSKSRSQSFLDPSSGAGSLAGGSIFDQQNNTTALRHHSDEPPRRAQNSLSGGPNLGGFNSFSARSTSYASHGQSGYNSGVASRSGSQPPSRNGVPQFGGDYSPEFSESQFDGPELRTQRPNHVSRLSTQTTINPSRKYSEQVSPMAPMHYGDFNGAFGRMDLNKDAQDAQISMYSPQSQHAPMNSVNIGLAPGPMNNGIYRNNSMSVDASGRQLGFTNQQRLGSKSNFSPHANEYHGSYNSPLYSSSGTPPTMRNGRAQSTSSQHGRIPQTNGIAQNLHQKLESLQQQQLQQLLGQQHYNQQGPVDIISFRNRYSGYDYTPQTALARIPNGLQYYQGQLNPVQMSPISPYNGRGSVSSEMSVDVNNAPVLRSALLEEFRCNSKTKRYELRDLYGHFVEFSGDQHGSRFIQNKLETANSDDKEAMFREIIPNALQLMTDVFGNYVVQKMFDHGNQMQKKMLAHTMKGHVLNLSFQMYGCRVVQKAFEYILTDQQASLVKELEKEVLNCVTDQNGNHVIQKAIERIPAEHISFILNGFSGHVYRLSTHTYGCRVIQRMLEHCQDSSRRNLLAELHQCASTLIVDQFGNYVTQHIIEHGDTDDRNKIINIIMDDVIHYSKHKFASNVVERCITFGSEEQKLRIASLVDVACERDELSLPGLIRDQYANYVIQKLLLNITEPTLTDFAKKCRYHLPAVKRISYGKQVGTIEKIVLQILGPDCPNASNSSPTRSARTPSSSSAAAEQIDEHSTTATQPPRLDTSTAITAPPPASTPPLVSADDSQSPQSSSMPSTRSSTLDPAEGRPSIAPVSETTSSVKQAQGGSGVVTIHVSNSSTTLQADGGGVAAA